MQKWELCTQIQWNNNKNESDSIWTGSREKLIFSGETVEMGKKQEINHQNTQIWLEAILKKYRRHWKKWQPQGRHLDFLIGFNQNL